jgi:hypothetical protein
VVEILPTNSTNDASAIVLMFDFLTMRKGGISMEVHKTMVFPCTGLRKDPLRPCNTIIAIVTDMGPSAFRCPVCNTIYVVDPLQEGSFETEGSGFGVMEEVDGHRIETFRGERTQIMQTNPWEAEKFYLAKVGNLENVFVADVHSPPGAGWNYIAPQQQTTSLPAMPSETTEFTQAQKGDRRYFGMTVVQIGILIVLGLAVCCVGSVAIYMLFGS